MVFHPFKIANLKKRLFGALPLAKRQGAEKPLFEIRNSKVVKNHSESTFAAGVHRNPNMSVT